MKYDNNTIKPAVAKKYRLYQKHIIKKENIIDGKKINRKKYPMVDKKCGTFFHMITKEKAPIPCVGVKSCSNPQCTYYFTYNPLINSPTEPRQICINRLDRISCINGFFNRNLKIWEKQVVTKKGIRNRILCFDDINNYLIILDEKNGNVKLWSGFPIDYPIRKQKLLKEYHIYINTTHKKHHTSIN